MEIVPLRTPAPVFSAIATVAVPDPDVPPATLIHGTEDEAVHAQSALTDTLTATFCGCGPTDTPVLDSDALQLLAACDTRRPRPPIVNVPRRVNEVELAATVYCTVPFPSPVPFDVTVTHGTLLDDAQVQPAGAITETDPELAADVSTTDVGLSEMVHAMPACVTVSVAPEIVMVPVLGVASGLAATVYERLPTPVPLPPGGIVIHGTELLAVHAQVLPVLIPTVRNADAEVSDTLVVDSVMAHAGAACVTVNARPPMVSVAVREALVVLAAIE
jgi:hypothetical protein